VEVGKVYTGVVQQILDFGAVVELIPGTGKTGLLHISEISKERIRNIKSYLDQGVTVNVKVVQKDEEKNRIRLSMKDVEQPASLREYIEKAAAGESAENAEGSDMADFQTRAPREGRDRGDRNDRSDRYERSDRGSRNDRNDRSDRNDRFDRSDRADRTDRSEQKYSNDDALAPQQQAAQQPEQQSGGQMDIYSSMIAQVNQNQQQ
jgi:predicted RNA-binding protein with RPS1 domain